MKHFVIAAAIACATIVAGAASALAQDTDYEGAFAARLASPDDTFALGRFLTVAVALGQYDQAISTVEQHLINHPRDAKARLIAARLYFNVGSFELARRQLTYALQIGTLDAEDTADAEDLLASVEARLRGIAASFFLTGGAHVVSTDYSDLCLPCTDRIDINPFATIGGRIVVDLDTPTSDALVLEGSLGATRRFGDFDFDGSGDIYTAWMGDFAITLSKGLPGIAPTLRADLTVFGNFESFDAGFARREIGVAKRLSARPSARTTVFSETALGWIGASSGLIGDWRAHFEAGGTARLDSGGTLGLAVRGFMDFDSGFAPVGHTGEIEASYSSQLAAVPDAFVWSQRLAAAFGVLSVPDVVFPPATFEGTYWRLGWDNVVRLDSGNRLNFGLSYQNSTYDDPSHDTAVLTGSASYTLVLD